MCGSEEHLSTRRAIYVCVRAMKFVTKKNANTHTHAHSLRQVHARTNRELCAVNCECANSAKLRYKSRATTGPNCDSGEFGNVANNGSGLDV